MDKCISAAKKWRYNFIRTTALGFRYSTQNEVLMFYGPGSIEDQFRVNKIVILDLYQAGPRAPATA